MGALWVLYQALALALTVLAAHVAVPAQSGRLAATPGPDACDANPAPPRDPRDPAIVATLPKNGADVASPLFVAGRARVFEAVVSIALLGPHGDLVAGRNVIARATTKAAAGAPENAPFIASVPFVVASPTDACLLVYEVSARDGSPQNVVQVPVRLEPTRSR